MSKKYPRTYHLPWSLGATNDDKIAKEISNILNNDIIITEKLDGSNTCLERYNCYARTHSGPPTHASFDGFKSLHAQIKFLIPDNLQLFGEWLYAVHSIEYNALPNYFLLFNVKNIETNIWLSWDEVKRIGNEISLPTVPVLFEGKVDTENELKQLTNDLMKNKSCYGDTIEGVVVRIKEEFNNNLFDKYVFKAVRANHVNTDIHWKNKEIIKNKLK